MAFTFFQNLHFATGKLSIICEKEIIKREVFIAFFVETEGPVLSYYGLLAKSWHYELEQRKWFVFEEVRLLNSNCFVLCIFFYEVHCIIKGHVILLQNCHLSSQNFNKLWLLLLQEIYFWEF